MVPRCHYPTVSSVSKYFRDLMASPELYKARSERNITESVLYGFIGFPPLELPRCYILHRTPHQNQVRLCKIDSLPPMPLGPAVVTIGHDMYVIGGWDCDGAIAGVFIIDCTTHKTRLLPSMNRARYGAAAGVIDGKIYTIGGFEKRFSSNDWVQVFDVKTHAWNRPVPGPYPLGTQNGLFEAYAVMGEKIYVLDRDSCFSYEPKNGKWELCERLGGFWRRPSCVVDDMLYTIDPIAVLGSCAVVYDPKVKDWLAVKGVYALPNLLYHESKMANFGGKLMILGASESYADGDQKDIWCVEIALERRQGGEISGKVRSVKRVFTSMKLPSIELSRTATV